MRRLTFFLSFLLLFTLLLTSCQTKGNSSEEDSILGESKAISSQVEEGPEPIEEIPPEELVATRQPINKELTGYKADNMHFSVTTEGEAAIATLSFEGLHPIGGMPEVSAGRVIYYAPEEMVSIGLYAGDVSQAHEVYEALYSSQSWEAEEFSARRYGEEGNLLEEEAAYSPEQLLEITQQLYHIIEKEMGTSGE